MEYTEYANITQQQADYLLTKRFERQSMVTWTEIKEVRKVLDLLSLTADELRALRNTVVCLMSGLESSYRFTRNYERYMQLSDTKSGVVACIDQILVDRFGEEVS